MKLPKHESLEILADKALEHLDKMFQNDEANNIPPTIWMAIFQMVSAELAKKSGISLEDYQAHLGTVAGDVKYIFEKDEK